MLDLAILGLLDEGPLHGYELRRRLLDLGLVSASFGSLYPALRRLNKEEAVQVVAREGRKKIYEITPDGEQKLRRLISEDFAGDEERELRMRVAFLGHAEPEVRVHLLEHLRWKLSERADKARSAAAGKKGQRKDRYRVSLLEHRVESYEAELAWIDELIVEERQGGPGQQQPGESVPAEIDHVDGQNGQKTPSGEPKTTDEILGVSD